ncbi:thiamine pyrophosphokinase [Morchella conica CCBAS932]|uniref:Thiamine pyrophosphokinase n=1 Tax=Morchella conica CCBAS932 TaxID=1392247 RepID=A0A3N4KQS4_9PEZI|nr:thiamine pyrophosphokinase [Morchella conica CCBAS932]
MGSSPSKPPTVWDPARYIDPARSDDDDDDDDRPFALLILNQEITDLELFENIWANIGDLDSLLPSIHAYYAAHGVPVLKNPDQDSTDFGKCLDYISQHTGLQSPEFTETHDALEGWRGVRVSATHSPIPVVALGGWGGRVDQSLHSIQALHTSANTRPTRRLTLVSSENITFLLTPGSHIIYTPRHLLGLTCGILPIGGAATVTTQGLRWNLRDAETRFGGLVSTSNHLAGDEVVVETSGCVVFTVEIRGGDCGGVGVERAATL